MAGKPNLSRRDVLIKGGIAAAGMTLLPSHVLAQLTQLARDETPVDWIDDFGPPQSPDFVLLDWNGLESWITPVDQFFSAGHYPEPTVDAANYSLEVTGAVKQKLSLGLDEIRSMPSKDVIFTLECSGNRGVPVFRGGVYNARWTGTPLAPILERAGCGATVSRWFSSDTTKG